jgi:hypothetical protein
LLLESLNFFLEIENFDFDVFYGLEAAFNSGFVDEEGFFFKGNKECFHLVFKFFDIFFGFIHMVVYMCFNGFVYSFTDFDKHFPLGKKVFGFFLPVVKFFRVVLFFEWSDHFFDDF